jgi:uncharacterized protein
MSNGLEVRESRIYGRGCFATRRFQARRKIAAYAGEFVRGRRKVLARLRVQHEPRIIWVGDDLGIDGAAGGDETAFINHSCEPNAFMRVTPGDRVIFCALRDILPGEEITINYKDLDHPSECRCGASRCRSVKSAAGNGSTVSK